MIVSVLVGVADPDAEARRWAEAFSWRVTRQVPASASSPRRLELASPARSSGRLILVQSRPGADLPCPGHLGWAALELAVQDVDSAAARAVAAGFSLLGEPAALSSTSSLRSAQLAGPGGLMVYLTQQVGDTGPFGLIPPLAPVDAIYGVVLATRRLERARARYEAVLAAERLSDHPVAVGVLNKVFGLDPARRTASARSAWARAAFSRSTSTRHRQLLRQILASPGGRACCFVRGARGPTARCR